MKSETVLLLYILSGVTMGLTYSLVALGFNVVYNATDVINFAQGEFVMLGALTAYSLNVHFKLPLIIAALISVAVVTLVAILIERLFINPDKRSGIILLCAVFGGAVYWVLSISLGASSLQFLFWITIGGLGLAEVLALTGIMSAVRASLSLLLFLCGGAVVFGILTPILAGLFVRLIGIPAGISLTISKIMAGAAALYVVLKPIITGALPEGVGGKTTIAGLIGAGIICGVLGMSTGTSLYFVLYLTAVAAIGLGAYMAYADVRPQIQNSATVFLIIVTIGLSIFLKGIASFIWGKNPIPVPAFSGTQNIPLLGAHFKPQDLWICGIAIATMLLFWVFYKYSLTGKAMRACSMDRKAAQLMGINVRNIIMLSFGLAGATGAVAGIIIAPIVNSGYGMGLWLGLMGFVAAIVGGLGSPLGAIVGGLTVGLLESAGSAFISSGYKHVVVFVALLVVLYVKPNGLLGVRESERF